MKRFNRVTGIVDTGLITSTLITEGISISIARWYCLKWNELLLSLASAIIRKSFKIFAIKQEKHDATKLLAQSKLGSIANIISEAMQDGDISPTEFHKVL